MAWQDIEVKNNITKLLSNLNINYTEDRECSVVQVTPNSKYDFNTVMAVFIWKTFTNITITLDNKVQSDNRLELLELLNMLNRETLFSVFLEKNTKGDEVLKVSTTVNSVSKLPSYSRIALDFIYKLERALDLLMNGNNAHAVYLVCEFDD